MIGTPKNCPYCGSGSLWRSRSSPLRIPARLVFLHPIRCGGCEQRFWRFTFSPPQYAPRTRVKSGSSTPSKVVALKPRETPAADEADTPIETPAADEADTPIEPSAAQPH